MIVARRPRVKPGVWVGLLMTLVVVSLAVLAPVLPMQPYDDQDLGRSLLPPVWVPGADSTYPLGTDFLGRDLLSRLIFAARTSLLVGTASVALGGMIGVPLGMLAGFFPGWIDDIIMRLADMQLAFPPVVLAISILVMLQPSVLTVVAVLGVIGWVQYARVIRGQTLTLRRREFVLAAHVLGANTSRILWRHILPNALGPILAIAALNISTMILAEASLSFLGVGVRPPTPAWGTMLSDGRDVFRAAWWTAVFPGVAIAWTVVGVNLLSDAWQQARS